MLQNLQKNFTMKEKENKATLSISVTRWQDHQLGYATPSSETSIKGAANNPVFYYNGNCKGRFKNLRERDSGLVHSSHLKQAVL